MVHRPIIFHHTREDSRMDHHPLRNTRGREDEVLGNRFYEASLSGHSSPTLIKMVTV